MPAAAPLASPTVSARRVIAVTLAVALIAAPSASADGDPASDVLLTDDVFFPYAPRTSPVLAQALERLLARVRAGGYPIKVALIGSAGDLGSYPQMFNDPQRYATLLDAELSTSPHPAGAARDDPHLLVVMPGGFGGDNLGDRVDDALAGIRIEAEAQSDGLAKAALIAAARIATVNGHRTPVPREASVRLAATSRSTERGSGPPIWIFLAPVALVVAGAAVAGRVARCRAPAAGEPQE